MFRRNGKVWLMTVALVIVPWGGFFLLLYGAWLLVVRTRRAAGPEGGSSVPHRARATLTRHDMSVRMGPVIVDG